MVQVHRIVSPTYSQGLPVIHQRHHSHDSRIKKKKTFYFGDFFISSPNKIENIDSRSGLNCSSLEAKKELFRP